MGSVKEPCAQFAGYRVRPVLVLGSRTPLRICTQCKNMGELTVLKLALSAILHLV